MRFIQSGLIVAISIASCFGDVTLGGGIQPARSVPYKRGLGLVEALEGSEVLTCSRVMVARGDSRFEVDLPSVLIKTDEDWSLSDGDIVVMPEHVFPCMDSADSAAFIALFRDHHLIRVGKIPRPEDWLTRIDRLPTHRKK